MRCTKIIVNPAAGQGRAPAFVKDYVAPIFKQANHLHDIQTTIGDADGIRIGFQLYASRDRERSNVLVIGGGDGTAHEVIEGILRASWETKEKDLGRWELIILPLGTANALFHSLFPPPYRESETFHQRAPELEFPADIVNQIPSLFRFLEGETQPRHLPISITSIIPPIGPSPDPIPSHIVLSTALHAGILKSSEALRKEYPGVERFKKAAEENVGIFHPATVKLLPSPGGSILQYSPADHAFVSPFTTDSGDMLEGPFSYFLSSNTAPRLESTFVIAPTLATIPPTEQTMDIVVLRPCRDPRVQRAIKAGGDPKGPEAWKPRIWEALMKAYEEGKHVELVYQGEGPLELAKQVKKGKQDVCVEVFRCGGFEWTPKNVSHGPSHVVCADGSLHTIPAGGRARVTLMYPPSPGQGFFAWG